MTITTSSRLIFLLIISITARVESHGYLKSPRARNYIAYADGVDYGGGANDYPKDYCPHCANRGGTDGQCGNTGQQWYDVPKNALGGIMPADPQAVYSQGQVIELDIVLTAHHKGHFEFAACPISHGQAPSGACFDKYPLTFVSDPLYGAVKDTRYPTRAYIAPSGFSGMKTDNTGVSGQFFRFRMKLPDNLSGNLVLLQWHYYTANTCQFAGYDSYPFPASWGSIGNVGVCQTISPNGSSAPEQFWNCAEIRITSGPTSPIASSPVPAPSRPTPAIMEPYRPPVNSQTPGTCGDGKIGNGVCSNKSLCCSAFGWCGSSAAHCNKSPTASPIAKAPAQSPISQAPPQPTLRAGTCGNGSKGNGICPDKSQCCSEFGWCGTSQAHCKNSGTQSQGMVFCFSGNTVVETKESGSVLMKDLQIGDQVLSRNGIFEEVYAFGHHSHAQRGAFTRLLPAGLELSSDHMVFIQGKGAVPASMVRVGDYFENGDRVTAIETDVVRTGVYAPFTPSGTIVLNNVTASSYVSFQNSSSLMLGSWISPVPFQWLNHLLLAPYRVWCIQLGMSDDTTANGLSTFASRGHGLADWLFVQHPIVVGPVLLVLGLFVSIFAVVEWILLSPNPYSLMLSTFLLGSICIHARRACVQARSTHNFKQSATTK